MKHIVCAFWGLVLTLDVSAQGVQLSRDSIEAYFREIGLATKAAENLWDRDLYGAILLVDPTDRKVYANELDAEHFLLPDGNIYHGTLPSDMNVANTSVSWLGKNWAMLMLPLPDERQDRINLLAHELFHRAQAELGFTQDNPDNNHLDQKNGRIYLRLELEALRKALLSASEKGSKQPIADALLFREFRHSLYPGAKASENLLELNEGIAEYTGVKVSARNREQTVEHLVRSMEAFLENPTFVRSFAYQTIPIYGFLLSANERDWNKAVTGQTNLTDYFIRMLKVDFPDDIADAAERTAIRYNGKDIAEQETERQERLQQRIAEYRNRFILQPHLEIRFEKMSVSFDPRNIMPLENEGTVYPNMRVVDNWGILTVENGALMSSDWSRISLSSPLATEGQKISGDGWTLELNDGFRIEQDKETGNYILKSTLH